MARPATRGPHTLRHTCAMRDSSSFGGDFGSSGRSSGGRRMPTCVVGDRCGVAGRWPGCDLPNLPAILRVSRSLGLRCWPALTTPRGCARSLPEGWPDGRGSCARSPPSRGRSFEPGSDSPCLDFGGAFARDRRAVRGAASAARGARAEGLTLTARRHARTSCRVVAGETPRARRAPAAAPRVAGVCARGARPRRLGGPPPPFWQSAGCQCSAACQGGRRAGYHGI